MFEAELAISFFVFGILFDRYLWPKVIWPKLKNRFQDGETVEREKHAGGRPKGSKNKKVNSS